ncbi:MAG: cytochrome c1 [Hyphomicrobiales bacterium]|nr:MAG: cytochrome c1 [Hyphomicrobiales bacterium]
MKTILSTLVRGTIAAAAIAAVTTAASAAGGARHVEHQKWSFAGPFGSYDRGALQRGFQIYKEVCSSCHSMRLVSFRNLSQPGGPEFSEEEVKALAAEYTVQDGPNDEGEMFEREGKPFDRFPSPFPNVQAAKSANSGAYPPDFSLLAKARATERGFPWFVFDIFTQYQEGGPDYIYQLLTTYEESPACGEDADGFYNATFAVGGVPDGCKDEHGHTTIEGTYIAMAPPLSEDLVEYTDGTPQTVKQYAEDVVTFMMWAAEPKLEARKAMGFRVMLFLVVFAGMLYFVKRKLWSKIPH